MVQWSEDVIKADPFFGRSRVRFRVPPPGFRTQLHVTTSLSTGGGPVSRVQLSEGGFQVVWLVVPVLRSCQSPIWIWLVNYLHLHLHLHLLFPKH